MRWSVLWLLVGCADKSWDGKSPLICSNNTTIAVKDCKVNLPGRVAVRADNNCTLTLERCTISADTAIAAENNTTIRLVDTVLVAKNIALDLANNVHVDAKRGRIEGGELAMRIDNHVHVALANTPVVGAVKRSNNSEVVGLPALEAEQAAERLASHGRLECAYSGTIGPNSRKMDRGYKFVPM